MHIFKNFPIRYKLLSGFLLIWIALICFFIYLLFSFNRFYQSLGQLNTQANERAAFSSLNTNTFQLSDAVKSYMLTKDKKWEKVYDSTSSQLQNTLLEITNGSDQKEKEQLVKFKETLTKLQGVELLILAKTREGDSAGALKLFDAYYESQQEHLLTLSNDLVANENNDFELTLFENNRIISESKLILGEIVFIVLLLVILIGYYFSSLIEKSIYELLLSVNKIAAGDLSTRAQINSQDEIGKLGTAFNEMATKLQEYYGVLERKVNEKTSELARNLIILENERAKDVAILESVTDGAVAIDLHANILFINPVALQLLDLNNENMQGKSIYDIYQLSDEKGVNIPQNERPSNITLQTGKKVSKTYTYIKKDKSKKLLNIDSTPIKQKDQVIGVIEIIRDVTKEREIDRMKTEFISLASHQLRTPLSAMKWFLEMLNGGDAGILNPEQQEMVKIVDESNERMIALVNSLLNVSRIESGRIVIEPVPTDLKELLDGVKNDIAQKLEEKKQHLIISVHSDLQKVNLDPKLIRQVYLNLLTNAIKYTPDNGEISIFVSKKDDQLLSQVSDTGYGIPESEKIRVFEKFYRGENIIKRVTDGTGLGLYLVKAIIESSHGKIWFKSTLDKGTTFWFTLPLSGMEAKKGEVTLDEYLK